MFMISHIPQVFTPTAAALFLLTGAGLFAYFRYEKERLGEQHSEYNYPSLYEVIYSRSIGQELEDKHVGRPNVGGPLSLVTHQGNPFTEQDLLGHWSLIYFGFTNCPDICPDELDKMSAAVDELGR